MLVFKHNQSNIIITKPEVRNVCKDGFLLFLIPALLTDLIMLSFSSISLVSALMYAQRVDLTTKDCCSAVAFQL